MNNHQKACYSATIILLLCAWLLSSPAMAEVSLTASTQPGGDNFGDSIQYKLRVGQQSGLYAFGSYSNHERVMETQTIGKIGVLTAGVGFRQFLTERLQWWAEVGYTDTRQRLRDFSVKEDIVFGLSAIYGVPPFMDYWEDVDYDYQTAGGYSAEIGLSYQVARHARIEASYYQLTMREHYGFWNEQLNNGPGGGLTGFNRMDCGCLWEGHRYNTLGGLKLGLTINF